MAEAIDHMADGTLIADAGGHICYASAQLARWFGYHPHELVGVPVEVLVPAERRAEHRRARDQYNTAPILRPMGGPLDIVGMRKDGARLVLDVWLAPLGDGFVLANIRDMTASHQRETDRAAESVAKRDLRDRDDQFRATQDTVIQRLFGIAASLEALAVSTAEPVLSARLAQSIELIDDTIKTVRDEAFGGGRLDG